MLDNIFLVAYGIIVSLIVYLVSVCLIETLQHYSLYLINVQNNLIYLTKNQERRSVISVLFISLILKFPGLKTDQISINLSFVFKPFPALLQPLISVLFTHNHNCVQLINYFHLTNFFQNNCFKWYLVHHSKIQYESQ